MLEPVSATESERQDNLRLVGLLMHKKAKKQGNQLCLGIVQSLGDDGPTSAAQQPTPPTHIPQCRRRGLYSYYFMFLFTNN